MRKLFPVILLAPVLWAVATTATEDVPLPPGGWDLATDGTRLTIRTREADLGEVLQGLQALMPAGVRFGSVPATNITVRFQNIELDRLLQRLGVSYVLTYGREQGGKDPSLEGAWVGYFEPGPSEAPPGALAGRAPGGGRRGPVGEGLWAKVGLYPPETPDPDNGVVVRSAYPVSIGLDGSIDDWPEEVGWQFVTPGMTGGGGGGLAATAGATNDADTSFAVASAADEEKLFFALRVNDDKKAVGEMKGQPPADDDLVRLVIDNLDANDPDRRMPELNMVIKRHHVLQRDPDNPELLRAAPVQFVRNSSGASVVIRDGEDGWTVEASMDLEALGIDPENQSNIGFNVRLVDYDAGEKDPRKLNWSRAERMGDQDGGGASNLGRIQLAPLQP